MDAKTVVEPKPTIDVEPKPTIDVEPKPTIDVEPKPTIDVEPKPTIDVEPKPTIDVEPKPTIDVEPKPTIAVEWDPIQSSQSPNVDAEIQDSNDFIEYYKEYQSNVWTKLFESNPDSTKEQILQAKISRLEEELEFNVDEIVYLQEDLKQASNKFIQTSIKSQIKFFKSLVENDQEKLSRLQNGNIEVLEKLEQKEAQYNIDQHLERIQRLENLKSKNLDYLSTNDKIMNYVSQYKGKNNDGNTLDEELTIFVLIKYGPDALSKDNPFLDKNWVKTNSVWSFGTEAGNDFDISQSRYKAVNYAFFYPSVGGVKTVLGFIFDTETYKIAAANQESIIILENLDMY